MKEIQKIYSLSKYLKESGYNPYIFCSNFDHFTHKNCVEGGSLWREKEEASTEVQGIESAVATIEEKVPVSNESKATSNSVKEGSEKSNQQQRRNNNHGQQKNNFKAPAQNKFQQNNNVPACPANLQRYRWWMGQLYQWRNISDINSLNNLVNEVSDASLEAFLLNEWYEKPLAELLADIPEESQLASLTRQSILREKMRKLSEQKHPICVEGVIVKVPNTEEWSVCYAFDNYQLRELSAYLPKALVRKYGLRPGQTIQGQLFVSPTYMQCPCVIKVNSVMGKSPEEMRTLAHFHMVSSPFVKLTFLRLTPLQWRKHLSDSITVS